MTCPIEKANILIVEDEVLIAKELESRLRNLGYHICGHATSGEKALAFVGHQRPDLIMMDIVLKGEIDGIDTAEVIRDKWLIPVVFLTAYADTNRLERAKLTYPFGYLLKPFQDRELKITVEMALYVAKVDAERKKAEDDLKKSSEFFKQTLDGFSSNIAILNEDGVILHVNRAWREFAETNGSTNTSGYEGVNYLKICDEAEGDCCDEASLFAAGIRDLIGNRIENFELEYPCHSPEKKRWFIGRARLYSYIDRNLIIVIHENITERKLTEKSLRQSEKKYRSLVEDQIELVSRFKPDGTFLFVNDGYCHFFAKQKEKLLGKKWQPVAHMDDLPMIEKKLTQLSPENPVVIIENRVFDGNGELRWTQFSNRAFFNENGIITEIQSVGRDITERKQAEMELRASEERFAKTFKHAPMLMTVSSLETGKLVEVNDAWCQVSGFSREESVGHSSIELGWVTEAQVMELKDRLKKVKRLNNLEIETKGKGGHKLQMLFNAEITSLRNQQVLIVSAIDITERKQAESILRNNEQKLQNILNSIPDMVLEVNSDLEILWANRASLNLNAEAIGQKCYGAFPGNQEPCQECPCVLAFQTGQLETGIMYQPTSKTAGESYWENIGIPLFTTDGKVQKVLEVSRNITAKMKYEEQIKNSLREKETLLKELNHRVKNNMQVIISLMRLQSDKIGDEQLKAPFLETRNRIYAMSAVHETLHQSENLSSVDLAEYLEKLSKMTFQTYMTEGGNIQFSTDIQSISVDLEKSYPIGLVINELLSNSLKYGFNDGQDGEISISGQLEGNIVRLLVSDTGIGIPTDFDWKNTDSLGLQIVRSLVEDQLGGTIDLDRTHGTKWTITFPV